MLNSVQKVFSLEHIWVVGITREMVINANGAVVSGLDDPSRPVIWYGESFTNMITWAENKSRNKSIGLNIEIAATDALTLEVDYHDSSAAKKGNPGRIMG